MRVETVRNHLGTFRRKVYSVAEWDCRVFMLRNEAGEWYCRTGESSPAIWSNRTGAAAARGQLKRSENSWKIVTFTVEGDTL